jgi:hypothetical protein
VSGDDEIKPLNATPMAISFSRDVQRSAFAGMDSTLGIKTDSPEQTPW